MSETQKAYAEAYERIGSVKGVAREFEKDPATVRKALQRAGVLQKLAMPLLSPIEGMSLKKVNTQVSGGEVKTQWITHDRDKETVLDALVAGLPALLKPIRGKSKAPKAKKGQKYNPDTMPLFALGDPHFGLLAWHEETGASFDSDIAESVTTGVIRKLVECTEPSKRCAIISVGDNFHADSAKPLTPGSGNVLDVDSRFNRVFEIALRTFKGAVYCALEVHETVELFIVPGNHDPTMSYALAWALHEYFSNNSRVSVCVAPRVRRYFTFGKNLIGITHGDKQKRGLLPGIMAEEMRKEWGKVEHCLWLLGHIHHLVREDIGRVQMEHLRTLAESDAWHSEKGYLSIKDARVITLHRDHGEISRHTVGKWAL